MSPKQGNRGITDLVMLSLVFQLSISFRGLLVLTHDMGASYQPLHGVWCNCRKLEFCRQALACEAGSLDPVIGTVTLQLMQLVPQKMAGRLSHFFGILSMANSFCFLGSAGWLCLFIKTYGTELCVKFHSFTSNLLIMIRVFELPTLQWCVRADKHLNGNACSGCGVSWCLLPLEIGVDETPSALVISPDAVLGAEARWARLVAELASSNTTRIWAREESTYKPSS